MPKGKEETRRSRSIQDMLTVRRVPFCRVHCGKVRVKGGWMELAEEGYPDFWTSLTWLETKTPRGKLSSAQKKKHAELRGWGELIYVVQNAREASSVIDSLIGSRGRVR